MPQSINVLIIDFYDSFTFNLAHLLEVEGATVLVVQDHAVEQEHLVRADAIVLSPGPGLPKETYSMQRVLNDWVGKKPILGVCLGMQGIALYFQNELYNLEKVRHGVAAVARKRFESDLLTGLNSSFEVGLYHSWAVKITNNELSVVADLEESKVVMAVENPFLHVYGVQFHPESILTKDGPRLLRNFLRIVEHSSK